MRAPYRIETEELVIRPYRPSDVPAAFATIEENVEHLAPFMPWVQDRPKTQDELLDLLLQFRGKHDLGEDFTLGIFDDTGEYIGGCGLHPRIGPGAIEIGYWVAKDRIGRGVATRVTSALTRVGFELMGVGRIELHVQPENTGSLKVPPRAGYTREGLRRKRLIFGDDDMRDSVAFVMVREEYEASPARTQEVRAFDAMDRPLALADTRSAD